MDNGTFDLPPDAHNSFIALIQGLRGGWQLLDDGRGKTQLAMAEPIRRLRLLRRVLVTLLFRPGPFRVANAVHVLQENDKYTGGHMGVLTSCVHRLGVLCMFLCIALGIANLFHIFKPLIIIFSIICL